MWTSITESLWWSAVGCTMFHFLWVGGVIGLFALGGRRLLRQSSPSVSYGFTICCLLALTLTLGVLFIHVVDRMRSQRDTMIGMGDVGREEDFALLTDSDVLWAADTPMPSSFAIVPAEDSYELSDTLTSYVTMASSVLPWVWIIGTPALLSTVILGLVGTHRLRKWSRLLENEPPSKISVRLAKDLGLEPIEIRVSDRIVSPTVVGIRRPSILLPNVALRQWRGNQLSMVLLHELWHVRRRDNVVNLVQRIIESVLFFHPVVWWISGWARADREYCCDSAVLRQTSQPIAYAEILAVLAGGDRVRERLAVAMGEHNLVARIQYVLNPDQRTAKIFPIVVAMAFLILGAASLAWATYARPGFIAVPVMSIPEEKEESLSPAAEAGSSAMHSHPDDQRVLRKTVKTGVTIQLVDEAGQAVSGARIGIQPKWWEICPFSPADVPSPLATSDQDGIYRIRSIEPLKISNCRPTVPCFAFHQERQLAGTLNLTQKDWGKEFKMIMRPVVQVKFVLDSKEVRDAGRSLTWSKGFIKLPDNGPASLLRDTQQAPFAFNYLLPPGDYVLLAFAGNDDMRETVLFFKCFKVPVGSPEVDLGVIQLPRAPHLRPLRGQSLSQRQSAEKPDLTHREEVTLE